MTKNVSQPCCYQLVGVPGSGKSTWVQNQNWISPEIVVSTDNHVEAYALSQKLTYNEVFDDYMKTAVNLMARDVELLRSSGSDIVWDQTSISMASRRRKFAMLPDYRHIAVVFATPDRDELHRRLNQRPGKLIPPHVINRMINNWDAPEHAEGFAEIWHVS